VPTLSNIWIMRRGYGESREEAMADFKAAWERKP
jgi:predicted RNase H-like HicB family nuclease